jgi:predicted lipoprotein with Yx(FWY)xxD motif
VSVRHTRLGNVLVDSHGRTLYLFDKDRARRSACFGACAGVWPPLTTSGRPRAGRGAVASELGSTRRGRRALQVTYDGHPLYQYAGDSRAGQTNGEGLNQFGARWWAVSPAGRRVTR